MWCIKYLMKRLIQYLKRSRLTQEAFAASLGVSQATISRIILQQAKPSLALAVRIEAATGGAVRPSDFFAQPHDTQKEKFE